MHYVFPIIMEILPTFASQPIIMEICKEFRVEWESVVSFVKMKNVGKGRGEKEERAEGGGGGGWWWSWAGVCVCCKLRDKFLSKVRTQPVLFLFVHPEKLDEEELPELIKVCAKPVLLVTMHLALCLQMPGMMVGMDHMDGKIWQHTQQKHSFTMQGF